MYRPHLKKKTKQNKTKQNKKKERKTKNKKQNKKEPICQSCIYHYWAAREGNAHSRNEKQHSFCGDKRQNGGGISQKALRVPLPHK